MLAMPAASAARLMRKDSSGPTPGSGADPGVAGADPGVVGAAPGARMRFDSMVCWVPRVTGAF
jgi:hypothetical protein